MIRPRTPQELCEHINRTVIPVLLKNGLTTMSEDLTDCAEVIQDLLKRTRIREGTKLILPPFEDQPEQYATAAQSPEENGMLIVHLEGGTYNPDGDDGVRELHVDQCVIDERFN